MSSPFIDPEKVKSATARVLACAACKQRRVKCNRSFPCSNCIRAGVQCLQPAVHQRRRRFAERELLDRLHHYEDLLRMNDIPFDSAHGTTPASATPGDNNDDDENDDNNAYSTRKNQDEDTEASSHRAVWQSIKRVALDDEDDDDSDGNSSDYNYEHENRHVKLVVKAHDHLLFGAPDPDAQLPCMHPGQVQIFQLWQIYLDNVNPLLKVTHTPTLQPRIIEAAGNLEILDDALEALMFSIYCVAILSLTDDECLASFQLSRDHLLAQYQVACKQALLKCSPWRSNSVDCLTALYLYLVSVAQQVDPRSLACMVAVAIRIAQRMGLPHESSYNAPGCKALEAEMKRRLWWSLVLFDHRICSIVGQERSTSLSPIWDCRPPLKVNDFEIQADMNKPPAKHDTSATEALFAVVRSELADFVRQSASHLAIIGGRPSAEMIAQASRAGGELKALEILIENQHLAHCDPSVPLHFMTIWSTRSFFARTRLMEHYMTHAKAAPEQLTEAHRSQAQSYAIQMLECDTALRTSPLTKRYLWLVEAMYSPILAYLHILNGLTKRPGEEYADKAWSAICDNYVALINGPAHHRTRLMFALKFSRLTLQAWEARENHRAQENNPPEPPPRLVLDARVSAMQMSPSSPLAANSSLGSHFAGFTPSLSLMTASGSSPASLMHAPSPDLRILQGPMERDNFGGQAAAGFFPDNMSGQAPMDIGMNQFWPGDAFKWM